MNLGIPYFGILKKSFAESINMNCFLNWYVVTITKTF